MAARLGAGGEARGADGEPPVQAPGDAVVAHGCPESAGHPTGGDRRRVARLLLRRSARFCFVMKDWTEKTEADMIDDSSGWASGTYIGTLRAGPRARGPRRGITSCMSFDLS